MKKLIMFFMACLLALSSLAFGAASVKNPALVRLPDNGVAIPILRESLDSGSSGKPYLIHLDTSEIDTGYIILDILNSTIYSIIDTVGVVSMTCRDSTGTDTIATMLKWQANTRPDGKGAWKNLDSLEQKDLGASGAAAQGIFRDTAKAVVLTGNYSALRFFLRNKLATNANRKSTCKDVMLIRRPRAGFIKR